MHTSFARVLILSTIVIAILALVTAIIISSPRRADSANSMPLTGHAWSETTGWMSFSSGAADSVSMDTAGWITGFAWSENIGWVKFGSLASFPVGADTTAANARVVSGRLTGWARACAGTASGDCSSMVSRTDGWDGWISLSGTGYNVWHNSTTTGTFVGFAWGDTNVGAIDFSPVATAAQCSVSQGDNTCGANPNNLYWHDVQGNVCITACSPTYTCDGATLPAVCTPPPPAGGTFTALPAIVGQGKTVTVQWNMTSVKNNLVNACEVTGTNGDAWTSTADLSGNSTGSYVSSAINKQTTYTMTCMGANDVAIILNTTVNVIPKFREI